MNMFGSANFLSDIKPLKIYSLNDKKYILSIEFYRTVGLRMCNYTRWVISALEVGKPGIDYFPSPENVQGRTIRFRLRYFFEIDFSIGLCLTIKYSKKASELRQFLVSKKSDCDTEQIKYIPLSNPAAPIRDVDYYKNSRQKKAIQYDLNGIKIKEYSTVIEAAKCNNVYGSHIHAVCRGLRNTAGGFRWKYGE